MTCRSSRGQLRAVSPRWGIPPSTRCSPDASWPRTPPAGCVRWQRPSPRSTRRRREANWPPRRAPGRCSDCTFGSSAERARSRHRSRPALLSRLGSRLGAAAAVGMVALSAAAAAAYTGALPAPVQNLAHYTIGAPSGHRTAPSTQVGQEQPAATAGHRLCVTFTHLNAHRRARQKAVDFHHLAAAAGGAAHVKAYCAAAAHPGTATPGQPAHHRAGDPGSSPTPRSAGHPSGRPSPNPASWPSPLPASGPGPNPTVGPSPSPTVGPTPSPNGGPSPSPSSTGQPTSQSTGSSTAQPQRAGRPALRVSQRPNPRNRRPGLV